MTLRLPLALKLARAQERVSRLRPLLETVQQEENEAAIVRACIAGQINDRLRLIARYEQRMAIVRDLVERQRAMEPPNNFLI